nr:MAG TPA: tail protein [Caudoviricetes sp.]
MITFVDEKGTEHSALVAYSVTNAVNGELSVKGTIYTNDKILHGIGRGWRFRLDDEYYRITYAKPNDTGRQIEVEFDAVHQFFYDMSKSMVYTTLNGSKPFETYLQAVFSNSDYTYNLETTVGSIRKENFGNKSRLSLFNDIIKTAGLEFSVRGHVVRILKRIGTDLSTIVRKDFNMNELKIEKDINSFVTYQRGLGAWKDDEDHSKGRYETSYESPLSAIYGRIEADPVVDERYKDTGKLLERLKENVDKSYKVSVEIDMEDLSQAGYRISRPNPGDYIMAINETLGFRQKVRIVSFTSEYDVGGKLISRKVVCNDIGTVQRATSEISHLSRTLTDSIEGSERALKTATRALVSADGKNTNYFEDVKPLDVPKGTLRKGDRLFLTVGDKKQLYFWNGAEWELEPTEFDHEKFDMEFNRKSQEIKKVIQENRQKAEEALRNAGASSLLAQEAKRIGLDSIARLEDFKRQTMSAQTALSGDLDALKRTVTSEVNQASEYRRTTTEALSRMTGQMNGFATKSEVKQGIDGLTQTFAKMKVGGRNYAEDYDFSRGLWVYSQGDGSPIDWKITNGEYNVKGTTNTWKQMQIQSKEGSRSSWKGSTSLLDLEVGETYTLSFQGICYSGSSSVWLSLRANRTAPSNPEIMYGNFNLTSSWQTYQVTIPALTKPENFDFWRIILGYNEIGHVAFRKVELTRSSTRIDAGPAPEDGKTDLVVAKSEFQKTADGLSAKLATVENYVGQDGQRQEALRRYTREESAKQATSVRELVTRDYVGKSAYQEDVRGIERRLEAITNPQNGSIATQIAKYKTAVDGRFADITSMIAGKANQVDFQRVRETSQLYERILGNTENGIADKVARMAMTNQLFQVEVGKAFADHQNLFLTSTLTKGFLGNNGIIYVANATQKEVTSDFISVDPNEKIIFQHWVTLPENGMAWTAWQFFDKNKNPIDNRKPGLNAYKTTVGKQHNINQITVPANAYFVRFSARMYDDGLIKVEHGSVPSDYSVAPNDALEAVKTVQRQLAGSWAVQNINGVGSIVSQINATNNQILIEAEKIRLKGKTLLDELTAIQGYFKRLFVGDASVGTLNSDIIRSNSITADKLVMDMAMARRFVSSDIFTDTLATKEAFINKLRSVVVTATLLEGFQGLIGGFRFGQYPNRNGYFITGISSVSVGMGNGTNAGANRNAFWANWGESLDTPGPKAWYVNTDGKMYCRNEATFHSKVDFSSISNPNFYSKIKAHKGVWVGTDDVNGEGDNPDGGYNRVVWWSQIVTGKWRQYAGITTASDRKLKENIESTPIKALDKITALNLVAFDYIKDKTHEEIGLIAQEVLNIIPSSVEKYEDEDNHLTINYSKFVPYLIKAIQELNQKIEKMEKTIS